jgi:DNA phosphorothioation-dependent restriction protein DptH
MSLSQIIKDVIEDQISSTSSSRPTARFMIEGIPSVELDSVLELLQGQGMSTDDGADLNFLVISDSSDRLWDEGAPSSGAYRQDQITRARNTPDQGYVMAAPEGVGALGTLEGPAEIRPNIMPLVEERLFQSLFASDSQLGKDMRAAMHKVLSARFGAKDIPNQKRWELLAKLSRLSGACSPKDPVLATIGLPSCPNADLLGEKRHMDLVKKLAMNASNKGISTFFLELTTAASSLGDQAKEVEDALDACKESIINSARNAAIWQADPYLHFSPLYGADNPDSVPTWWKVLDLETWENLLESGPPAAESLQVKLSGENVIDVCCNTAVYAGKDSLTAGLAGRDGTDTKTSGEWTLRQARTNLDSGIVGEKYDIPTTDHAKPLQACCQPDGSETPVKSSKFIMLSSFEPGIVIIPDQAISTALPLITANGCSTSIEFPSIGEYRCRLLLADNVKIEGIEGEDIDEDTEGMSTPFDWIEEDKGSFREAKFEIRTDASCSYKIAYAINRDGEAPQKMILEVQITAASEPPEQAVTVIDALLLEHTSFGGSRPDVIADRNTSPLMLIGSWKLAHKEGYKPGIIALSKLAKHEIKHPESWDNWLVGPVEIASDPRPPVDQWNPPASLIKARESIRNHLVKRASDSGVIEAIRLGQVWGDSQFHEDLIVYCREFENWSKRDKDAASWWESILLVEPHDNSNILQPEPTCILLSPLHPLRLRWLAQVQGVMEEALTIDHRVPMLGPLVASSWPENWVVGHDGRKREFMSLGQASCYWGLLWRETQVTRAALSSAVLDALSKLGLSLGGLRHNLGKGHVQGILDDCVALNPAKHGLTIEIHGKDDAGQVTDGILDWFGKRTEDVDEVALMNNGAFVADMLQISPLELNVVCRHGSDEPDSSRLAAYAGRELGILKWHSCDSNVRREPNDVVILAGIPPAALDIVSGKFRGARDEADVVSIRPMWMSADGPMEPVETSSFKDRAPGSGKAAIFITDGNLVMEALGRGKLVALPSGVINPANVPHMLGAKGVVWKMEYPGYTASVGIDQGYLVISGIGEILISNVRALLEHLAGKEQNISDDQISSLLLEYGQRGFDSLHQTADRSVSARASLAMLTAVRILQPFNTDSAILPSDCNVEGGAGFIVPLDPFAAKLRHLWKSIEKKHKSGPRPDLIALAILPDESNGGLRVKVTPIEVKCHTSELNITKRASILANQCRRFANFLKKLFIEYPEKGQAWNVGARLFLAELVSVGARINSHGAPGWADEEGAHKLTSILARLMGPVSIQIGDAGRLVVVDGSHDSNWKNQDHDFDTSGFTETMQLDRRKVASFLNGETLNLPSRDDHWKLIPEGGDPMPAICWDPVSTGNFRESVPAPEKKDPEEEEPTKIAGATSEEGKVGNTERNADSGITEVTVRNQAAAPETKSASKEPKIFPRPEIKLGISDSDKKVQWAPYGYDSGPGRLNNGHVVVVGSSGAGKTFLLQKVIARQIAAYKIPSLYIDFNDDFTGSDFLKEVDANLLRADLGLPINPLEVPEHPQHGGMRVMNHIYELKEIFEKAFGLGTQQAVDFKSALESTYAEYGIVEPVLEHAPQKWPTFDDFGKYLKATENKELMNRVSPIFDLKIFSGGDGGMEKRLKESTVLGLSLLPSDMVRKAISDLFLKTTYQYLLRSGHADGIKLAIIIDEAHKVANLPSTSLLLKEGRKFGASLWVSSQEPKDFNSTVWSNCGTQIFFRVDELMNAKNSAKQLGQADLAEDLRCLDVGSCFLRNLHYQPYTRLKVTV